MKLLVFGEVLFDIYGDEKYIGGAPLNFSAHSSREGSDVFLLSAVGRDALGELALDKIRNYGVNTEYIHRSQSHSTGVCNVTLDTHGVPRYELVQNTAYDNIPFNNELEGVSFNGLYFGTLALRSMYNRETLKRIISSCRLDEIFVDINVRKPFCDKESILIGLNNATVLKISDEELPFVINEIFGFCECDIDSYVKMISEKFTGIKIILITCGEKGSVAYNIKSKKVFRCDAVKTEIVSTVGAGDSFSAAFLARYLDKQDIGECLEHASKVSSYVVSKKDAIPD